MYRFATALNCIDGRTQLPVIHWMQNIYCVEFVDLITQPGIDKVLSHCDMEETEIIKKSTIISVEAHNSEVIAVVGHHDCAANPVSPNQHFYDIMSSINVVKSWNIPSVNVIGLWVDRYWQVHLISEQ